MGWLAVTGKRQNFLLTWAALVWDCENMIWSSWIRWKWVQRREPLDKGWHGFFPLGRWGCTHEKEGDSLTAWWRQWRQNWKYLTFMGLPYRIMLELQRKACVWHWERKRAEWYMESPGKEEIRCKPVIEKSWIKYQESSGRPTAGAVARPPPYLQAIPLQTVCSYV